MLYVQIMTNPRRQITFSHIPKTSGTYITQLLLMQGIALEPIKPLQKICSNYHTPLRYASRTSTLAISVARNPYERLISEYMFECWANKENLAVILEAYKIMNVQSCQTNRTQLNRFLRSRLPREHRYSMLIDANESKTDCHLLCQSEYGTYIDANMKVLCADKVRSQLSAWLNTSITYHRNVSKYNVTHLLDRDTIVMIDKLCPNDRKIYEQACELRTDHILASQVAYPS